MRATGATTPRQASDLTGSSVPDSSTPDLEAAIAAAIDPWLAHMTWRADFAAWRKRRLWQENHQADNLRDIRAAFGDKLQSAGMLDLGAGMGGLSVALLRELAGTQFSLVALDYNPAYAQVARLRGRRYSLELPIVVGAGERLPFPDSRFEGVLCMDVLEHVADPRAVLSEINRVLKPGGVVLTTVPNRRAFRDPHYHLPLINWLPRIVAERVILLARHEKKGTQLQDRQALSELNTYTWAEFKRLAASAGFSARDQVMSRISTGEIRQLKGPRRALLDVIRKLGLLGPLYAVYRYGWQGTYQIMLVKQH